MRSENPDEIGQSPSARRKVLIPLACSVLLHGLLIGVIARAAFTPPAEGRIPEERAALRVSVVIRAPPTTPEPLEPELARALEPAAEATLVEDQAAAAKRALVEEDTLAEEAALAEEDTLAEEAALAEEAVALPAVEDTARAQQDALSTAEVGADETPGSTAAWTPSRVRAAVSGYISGQRDAHIETWVAACIIERKSEHTRDCEGQRGGSEGRSASSQAGRGVVAGTVAAMTRRWRAAQLTGELEMQKVFLEGLMDEEGPVGQLAADRYYLDSEIVRYLNGNPSPYGPRNQFICGKRIAGTALRRPVPCVYEYTGFVIVAPEQPVDPDAFRVAPTLFGSAR